MMGRLRVLGLLVTGVLIAVAATPVVATETHVVSAADFQKEVVATSQVKQHNLETLSAFVSSERAQKALKTGHMDAQQVKTAVSMLTSEELAELAPQAKKAQADFAAGTLSERDLILIILGIAVLVLIIVAVR
jgi:hypothetical protein